MISFADYAHAISFYCNHITRFDFYGRQFRATPTRAVAGTSSLVSRASHLQHLLSAECRNAALQWSCTGYFQVPGVQPVAISAYELKLYNAGTLKSLPTSSRVDSPHFKYVIHCCGKGTITLET